MVADPMRLWHNCQQGTIGSWLWGMFLQHGLGLLVHLSISLTVNLYIALLYGHLRHSWTPHTPKMRDYSNRIIPYFTGTKLLRIGLRNILETSNKWCDSNMNPLRHLWNLFACKIIQIQRAADYNKVDTSQHNTRGILTTCGIDSMLSCCSLVG